MLDSSAIYCGSNFNAIIEGVDLILFCVASFTVEIVNAHRRNQADLDRPSCPEAWAANCSLIRSRFLPECEEYDNRIPISSVSAIIADTDESGAPR